MLTPGTYTGENNRDIDFLGKAITVRSTNPNDPCVVADTIIDCNGSEANPHRGFNFHNNEDANSVINGLTITNGFSSWRGGGIYCDSSSPTLTNCTFTSNSTYSPYRNGGGMYNVESSPTVTNCTFNNNFAYYGGGMYNDSSNPILTGCTFINNSAEMLCGGMLNRNYSNPTLTNCTFSGNSAALSGGGMYNWEHSNPILKDCTFTNNSVKQGGGMFNRHYSNPVLTNCTFSSNSAHYGGGMHNSSYSSPTVTNCTFNNNLAIAYGGGMRNVDNSSPTLTNCTFSNNSAGWGGGMHNAKSSPLLINCIFSNNSADCAGGIYNIENSNPKLSNCTLIGNLATEYEGGGMFNWDDCNPTLTNCTFSNNSTNLLGGAMYNRLRCNSIITNCVLWGNTPQELHNERDSNPIITYSDVQGGWPGPDNIDADPCFVSPGYWADANDPNIAAEPDDPNAIWVEGDYHLLPTSPCIDAASDAGVYTDIEGNIRPFDFPGIDNNPNLPEFDMGAYEATVQTEGKLLIFPQLINRHSHRQKRILALVRLPKGVTKDQIDSNEPLILYPDGDPNSIEATHQFVIQHSRRGNRRTSIFAFFDKAELMKIVPDGRVELHVVGMFNTGRYFHGSDTVRIKGWRWKRWRRH